MEKLLGTTILAVKRNGKTAIAGDGQATYGNVVLKSTSRKVRRIYDDKVICGFAGVVADAFSLLEKFEEMLQKYSGNLMRSAVELAQLWRRDESMRKLESMLIVADENTLLTVSGVGEVFEPDDGVCSIGSGSNYALSAARALLDNTNLSAREIAEKSLNIAADLCIYTNHNIIVEEL